jgi:hypothetical protein
LIGYFIYIITKKRNINVKMKKTYIIGFQQGSPFWSLMGDKAASMAWTWYGMPAALSPSSI